MNNNQKKNLFPLDIKYDVYNFKPYEVLNAEQLNLIQYNIESVFNLLEDAINILNEKSLGSLKEFLGYKGEIYSLKNEDTNKPSLETLEKSQSGDFYVLKDDPRNIDIFNGTYHTHFKNNDILLCSYDFNFKEESSKDTYPFDKLWCSKNNLFESATENTSGLITTYFQYINGLKAFLDGLILRGPTLDIDVSSLKIVINGIEKELPNFGDLGKMKEDIKYLMENCMTDSIPEKDIKALFL